MASIQDLLNQDRDSKKRDEDREKDEKATQVKNYQAWIRNTLQPAVKLYCRPHIQTWIQHIEPFIKEVSEVEEIKARGAFIASPTEHVRVATQSVMDIYAKGDYSIQLSTSHHLNTERNNSGIFSEKELAPLGETFYKYHKVATIKQIVAMLGGHEILCSIKWHNEAIEKSNLKEPENLMRFDFHSDGELAGVCWVTTASGGGTIIGNIKNGLGDEAREIIAKRLIADDFLRYEHKPKTTSSGSPYGGISFLSGGLFGFGK